MRFCIHIRQSVHAQSPECLDRQSCPSSTHLRTKPVRGAKRNTILTGKKIPPMLSDFLTAVNATKILTFLRKGPILDQAQQLLPNVGNSSPCNKVVETWKHLKVIRRRTSACRRRFLECSFCCVFCHHYHYHKRKHAIPPQTLTLSL